MSVGHANRLRTTILAVKEHALITLGLRTVLLIGATPFVE
jgi:hypothetical protein